MTSAPVATIGVLADVQSGDKADGDGEGRVQRYRAAPGSLARPLTFTVSDLACVVSLGDIVDGRDDEASTRRDLADVTAHFRRLGRPCHHVVGNHFFPGRTPPLSICCASCVRRRRTILSTSSPARCSGSCSTRPTSRRTAAGPRLRQTQRGAGVHGGAQDEPQVLQYNGGVGRTQLQWIRDELRRAEREDVRLIVARTTRSRLARHATPTARGTATRWRRCSWRAAPSCCASPATITWARSPCGTARRL